MQNRKEKERAHMDVLLVVVGVVLGTVIFNFYRKMLGVVYFSGKKMIIDWCICFTIAIFIGGWFVGLFV